ncbi:MAG TPA: MFS transporter [Polyangia bacterium]
MIAEVFPPKERGRALGLWGVGVVVGPAFGPTLGGYLTETLPRKPVHLRPAERSLRHLWCVCRPGAA